MSIKINAGLSFEILNNQISKLLELELSFKLRLKIINQAKSIEDAIKPLQDKLKEYVDINFNGQIPVNTITTNDSEGNSTTIVNPEFIKFQNYQNELTNTDIEVNCVKIPINELNDNCCNNKLNITAYLLNFVKE